jgi:DNA invertase Pin-like site-specific DNA recombinase
MSADAAKVTASRLHRDAYLYIRQSTLYQVANNTESTTRQYDLRGRAVALGWPAERIHIVDIDQGQSGAHAADREGFQHLVAEVSMGRAGIVLGLECSRLARNNADWQRLLEICAHTDTLICDEDGLYDPTDFNDRLLLGLKGTLAESELHFLRSRLRGGILTKARRGQLRLPPPIGLVHDPRGELVLDPDAGVRHAVALLFDTFTATGSAFTTVKTFRDQQLTFPGRHRGGPHAGELYWKPLTHSKVLNLLHNPAYAGAYAYGRARHTVDLDGQHHTLTKPIDEWTVLIHQHHPGYITWERFQTNQSALAANAAAHGGDRKAGPPREGSALLQGLVLCGRCGRRMTVRYHSRVDATLVPEYVCQSDAITNAHPICQHMQGHTIDTAVADLALQTLTPLALEVALSVSDELHARAAQADQIRATHIQRAQHAADTARRRYLAVDPANRLVAETLEADWNHKLRELADAQDDYDRAKNDTHQLDQAQRERVRALAADLPALWNNPATPMRERKRLIRLLITDVTLNRGAHHITANVRLPGGQHHTLTIPIPMAGWHKTRTPQATLTVLGNLLATHTNSQAAAALNAAGLTDGAGRPFTTDRVRYHCYFYNIPTLAQRCQATGMLSLDQIAADLDVHPFTAKRWHQLGLITGVQSDDRGTCLFHPGQTRPNRTAVTAANLAATHQITDLQQGGMRTRAQIATDLGVHEFTIQRWHNLGLITGIRIDGHGTCLFHPGQTRPTPAQVTAADRARRSPHANPDQPNRTENVSTPRHNRISTTT